MICGQICLPYDSPASQFRRPLDSIIQCHVGDAASNEARCRVGGRATVLFSIQWWNSPGDVRRMAEQKATNVTWHAHNITREDRQKLNGHRGAVLWFTGLSGCGKSTIANAVDQMLHERGVHTFVLDGDNIRMGLNKNLGFSPEDRTENIRRIGEVAKLFADGATIVSTAFISPYKADRDLVRGLMPQGEFIEIMVEASLETCEARDPKGLYKKARAGEIKNFTGISAPYEAPEKPELTLDSDSKGIEELAKEVIAYLENAGFLKM